MKKIFLLCLLLVIGCSSACKVSGPEKTIIDKLDSEKIIVSSNGRFLQRETGEPFFWLADTGWLLFAKLNRKEAEIYLENRRQLGFNVIQVMVLQDSYWENVYGDSALTNFNASTPKVTDGNDPADPEQYDFWDHMDYIIQTAGEKGIYVGLVPVWGSLVKTKVVKEEHLEFYAAWIANRYKDYPNIFWLNGGDMAGITKKDAWNTIGETIKSNDPNHLVTFHPNGRSQSSTWFHNESWLDFNMFQSGHMNYSQGDGEDNWRYVNDDYAKTPVKPTLDAEPSYENILQGLHDKSQPYWEAHDVRRYAYWSVFAGSCGHTYGHNGLWQMYLSESDRAFFGAKDFWYDAINAPGGRQMQFVKKLMLSRPYFERVPDQSIVAGDPGSQHDYVIATRGESYLFVYDYSGRDFDINMGKITGEQVQAWWYNPRDGQATNAGVFANSGTQTFDPPGDKEEGNDWVLVLDDVSKMYRVPGL